MPTLKIEPVAQKKTQIDDGATEMSNSPTAATKQRRPIATLPSMDQINPLQEEIENNNVPPSPKVPTSAILLSPPKPSANPEVPSQPSEAVDLVQIGGGLPALPPRPPVPQRQANATIQVSNNSTSFQLRKPNLPALKEASKPQLNLPPGSDLGVVGRIGVYQMSRHASSASDIHANIFFWIYATILVTFIVMRRTH